VEISLPMPLKHAGSFDMVSMSMLEPELVNKMKVGQASQVHMYTMHAVLRIRGRGDLAGLPQRKWQGMLAR
jgi:hypothetical protein